MVALVAYGILRLAPGGTDFLAAFAGRVAQLASPEKYSTGTVYGRTTMWTAMWVDIVRDPLAGSGQDAYLRYFPDEFGEGSHNFPLEVWHAAGLIGFGAYLIMHAVMLIQPTVLLLRYPRRLASEYWIVLGALSASIALVLASFTNLIYWNPAYWIVLGLAAASTTLAQRRLANARPPAKV